MPQQDGTGPKGNGPKTGRGLGNCPPKQTQNNPGRGRGRGLGRGKK